MKTTTNLQIKIEVIDDDATMGVFEKTCETLDEAINYLEGLRSREKYHSVSF